MASEFLDLLDKAVKEAIKLGAEYVDARFEQRTETRVSVRKGYVESSGIDVIRGFGVRALVNGSWGLSSTDKVSEKAIMDAIRNAVKLAKTSSPIRSRKVKLADVETHEDHVVAKVKVKLGEVSVEEKVKEVLEADEVLRSYSPLIKDDRVFYNDQTFFKAFVSSEGTNVIVEGCRVYVRVYSTAGEAGVLSPAYEAVGGVKGFEVLREGEHLEAAKRVAERSVKLLKARVPKGGVTTVVLDNKLLALIVHEAFGHTAEADLVLTGTVLTNKVGQKIVSELVTIVDDPEPMNANGWTPYDDEGVKARKVIIVEDGILREYMQTRETAMALGMKPTGNARAQSYAHPPIVRMRNTYMLPRDWKPEEIIEETKEGYYLKGAMGGQADANGEFMFGVQEAWRIENGELREPYKGVTVSGNALAVLSSVDAVGNDLIIGFPGTCGKFQMVPVDGGGPHIRCQIRIGGR